MRALNVCSNPQGNILGPWTQVLAMLNTYLLGCWFLVAGLQIYILKIWCEIKHRPRHNVTIWLYYLVTLKMKVASISLSLVILMNYIPSLTLLPLKYVASCHVLFIWYKLPIYILYFISLSKFLFIQTVHYIPPVITITTNSATKSQI